MMSATFRRLTDARNWAKLTEAAILEGRHFGTKESKRRTVAEAIDRYMEQVLPSKSAGTIRGQRSRLRWWRKELGERLLADMATALLVEYRDTLSARYAAATVHFFLSALSHVFTIAVREWEWMEENPLQKVSRPKLPRGRVRFLSDDERERLLKVCRENSSHYLYPVVVLALSTGARKNEILSLTWDDIDFRRSMITLHETKNNERRSLPLTGLALDVLREYVRVHWRIDTHYVFPNKEGTRPLYVDGIFSRAHRKAGIEDFRFHDLRHSAASYLAMNGASLAEIAEILGHKTFDMVRRYAHLSD